MRALGPGRRRPPRRRGRLRACVLGGPDVLAGGGDHEPDRGRPHGHHGEPGGHAHQHGARRPHRLILSGERRSRGYRSAHDQHPRGRGRRRDPRRRSSAGCGSAASRWPRSATGLAGLEHVLHEAPQVVLLDLGLPDVDGLTLISMIRAASRRADHRDHRAGRRPDDGPGPRRRRRRLRRQAVRHRPGRGPDPRGAAARRARERPRVDPGRRAGRRRAQPHRHAWPGSRWTSPARSSTCCSRSPRGRGGGHQARAARRGLAAGVRRRPTGPSTCTCPGCAASSARRPPSRATCSASAGSAYAWSTPATGAP